MEIANKTAAPIAIKCFDSCMASTPAFGVGSTRSRLGLIHGIY